ncbi:DUF4270 family protein [Ancylomarina euxinus]|nr:DUF4270 family protein [Ancylomarina euxinus]MCZ4694255.1 DUF4270 family protein [Ancylomarina euxinus]
MRKIKSIVFVSMLVLLSSCNSDVFQEHEIGSNLIDKSTEVFSIDTFTVYSSTVKMDSVATSNNSNILLGKYKDPYFGNIKSDFYGEVDLQSAFTLRTISSGDKVGVKFDSLIFIMYHEGSKMINGRVNDHFFGDTLKEQTISIHRVTQDFEFPDNKFAYNADDVLEYDLEEIGSSVFIPKRHINSFIDEAKDKDPLEKKGGLRIKMNDALGLEIIDSVNIGSDVVTDGMKWLDYFKGVVLKSGDNNSAMFSYQTGVGMKMRLYYSETEYTEAGVVRFHDFPVNKKSVNFTNYSSDFNSEEHDYIKNIGLIDELENDLPSTETDNLSFIQGGTGLMTKISIPHIENLNQMGLAGGILKAELVFSPEDNSYDEDFYPLPFSNFELFTTDKKNKFNEGVFDPNTNKVVTSTYIYNSKYPDESYYMFDLTDYVNQILLNGQNYDDALLISIPPNMIGNSMERLIIDNDRKSKTRIKLKVTYVVQN